MTERQIQILQAMADGATTDDLRAQFPVGMKRIYRDIAEARRELRAKTIHQTIAAAVRQGVID